MYTYATPPATIETEVFAQLPDELRRPGRESSWAGARRGGAPAPFFLEGPAFDRQGNLYITDIPFGRIFRISPQGRFDLVAEYDGEPNGMKIHKDGRIFITDYKNGIMQLDPKSGAVTPYLDRHYTEGLKGVNDLFFASNGDLYFTDQGRTGHQDPSGRVFRLTAGGRLDRLLSTGVNPNGLVLNADENVLYVAMTNANAIWHLPLMPNGDVTSVGTFIQLSGGHGPDGLALTADGGLTVVHAGLGTVWIFNRRGEPSYRVVSCGSDFVTNVAYGGPDMKSLYITDAGAGLVLRATVPVAGQTLFSHQG